MTVLADNTRLVAWAQIGLSVLFVVGYFVILTLFLLGYIQTPPAWKDALTALLGVITASVVQIMGYWFARQRDNN